MGSEMVELSYEAGVGVRWYDYSEQPACAYVECITKVPDDVGEWIEADIEDMFYLTRKEYEDMVSYVTRTISFEVEVEYTEKDGVKKALGATLQNTGVPLSVGGYLEVQAMKQVDPSYTSLKEVRK